MNVRNESLYSVYMVRNLRASFRSEFLVRLKFFFYIAFVSQDSAHRSAIYIEGLKVAQEILEASEFLLPQRSKIEGLSHCKIYAGLCSLSPSFCASARAIASFQYLLRIYFLYCVRSLLLPRVR